jgi:competence protein ComEA
MTLLKPVLVLATLVLTLEPAWGAQVTPMKTKAAPPAANFNVNEPPAPGKTAPKPQAKPKKKPVLPRIDINSASPEELKKLPGIFDAEAAKIIAHRPYKSKAGLVVDAGLTGAQYFAIKDRVAAIQHSAK